ncbi:hypothetical protein EXIGLDRAFT_815653 [Exidia glandulosa HHB12029]|uniref:F-box domain-containing protein n=1 Tax=Exidia glandulosa HHB12029 TaxID=1314781 RepID=A0A165Z9Z2_EXIGL|nr:hypothetical protein EXIGLDRAFT_815653 [Exidia glandulosa HHB12029]
MAVFSDFPTELVGSTLAYFPPQDLWQYRLVSRVFDAEIQTNPRLYTDIDNVPVNQLGRFLNLSLALVVSVNMYCTEEEEYEILCTTLALHMSRISKLVISFDRDGWSAEAFSNAAPLVDLLSMRAPVLRHLQINTGLYYMEFHGRLLDDYAPHLRRVQLDGLELPTPHPALVHVEHFTGQAEWPTTLGETHAFTHIENLATYFPSLLKLELYDFVSAASIFGEEWQPCPPRLETLHIEYLEDDNFPNVNSTETGDSAIGPLLDSGCTRVKELTIMRPPDDLISLLLLGAEEIDSVILDKPNCVTFKTIKKRVFNFYDASDLEDTVATFILRPMRCLVVGRQISRECEYFFLERLAQMPHIDTVTILMENGGRILPKWAPVRHRLRMRFTALSELHITGERGTKLHYATLWDLLTRVIDLSANSQLPTLVLHGVEIPANDLSLLKRSQLAKFENIIEIGAPLYED